MHARSARQLPAWQPARSSGSRTGALRLPSGACNFRGQRREYHGQPGAGRPAGGWTFLYACGYGLPHRGKRGTGCAPGAARCTGGTTRRNACSSDCSAHLQRRKPCAPAACPSRSGVGGSQLRASLVRRRPSCGAAGSRVRQSRRLLPSHRPFLFPNLRQVGGRDGTAAVRFGQELQSTIEAIPGFLLVLVARASSMRSRPAGTAHAAASSITRQESGFRAHSSER